MSMTFIHLKIAYDTVDHQKLLQKCKFTAYAERNATGLYLTSIILNNAARSMDMYLIFRKYS